jgi:hypothetical protein
VSPELSNELASFAVSFVVPHGLGALARHAPDGWAHCADERDVRAPARRARLAGALIVAAFVAAAASAGRFISAPNRVTMYERL